MGLLDWIGPLSRSGNKTRGWGALPALEEKIYVQPDYGAALKVGMLVHGPGATEALAGDRGNAGNSAVFACLTVITTAYPEAPLKVWRVTPEERVELADSPYAQRLANMNPYLPSEVIWSWVQWAKRVDGNAYLQKVRAGNPDTGNVVELWPISPSLIEVITVKGSGDFISFYRYHWGVGDQYQDIPPHNMIHFRFGLDDKDHRLGLSPLKALSREVSTDAHASQFSDALLANFAVPGLVAQMPTGVKLTADAAEEIKAKLGARYGGDGRGTVGVLDNGATLGTVGWSPQQLDLKGLHRFPEERISAVLQVPAAVAGLGSGIDATKVGATMRELREMFTETCLVPSWRADAAVLNAQLKPDFSSDPQVMAEFDTTNVAALQDDENERATKVDTLVRGGQWTIDEARSEMGMDALPDGAGAVLLIPGAWAPTPISHLAALAAEAPPDASAPSNVTPITQPNTPPATPATAGATRRYALPPARKNLTQAEILARYEAGLSPLVESLADDLFDAFDEIADLACARVPQILSAEGELAPDKRLVAQHRAQRKAAEAVEIVPGLVTAADHDEIKSLLRSAVLKSMQQAADDLAPLTGGAPVKITRASPAVKAAVRDMESRLPGIIETTQHDFSKIVRDLERRPGSIAPFVVQDAIRAYVADTYPGRSTAIARTESGYAHNAGVLLVTEKSGIASRVHVHDGTSDGPCAARNGEVLTLAEAAGESLNHPNCQLRLIPMIEAA